mgnify:CR=1 FL=1|jgi:hypothetical protein
MFNYTKLEDNNKKTKIRKSDILNRYHFSKPMKLLFYLNILSIKKCGLQNAV